MKNIINILSLFALFLTAFSCRNNDVPEDIHEHEEISKITLTAIDRITGAKQTINYLGGKEDKALLLENGKIYDVKLDFFHEHDGNFESMLPEIEEEKDEHFITFAFGGVNVNVQRNATDIVRSDGHKMGVDTQWTVTGVPTNAMVVIKLFHGADSVNDQHPNATNQQGSVVGGEADVNAQINIR